MKPVEFEGYNLSLNKPEGWDKHEIGDCLTLPIQSGVMTATGFASMSPDEINKTHGLVVALKSHWRLSAEERQKIIDGADTIELVVLTRGHPPVSLGLK